MPLGWQELAVILLIVIVLFGANKLPEIGSGLGKGIRGFKEESGLDQPGEPQDEQDEAIERRNPREQVAEDITPEKQGAGIRADEI